MNLDRRALVLVMALALGGICLVVPRRAEVRALERRVERLRAWNGSMGGAPREVDELRRRVARIGAIEAGPPDIAGEAVRDGVVLARLDDGFEARGEYRKIVSFLARVAHALPRVMEVAADETGVRARFRIDGRGVAAAKGDSAYRPTSLRDPFRALPVERWTLRGVIHGADASRSVALLARQGSERAVRLRAGEARDGVRLLSVNGERAEVVIGGARREVLTLDGGGR